MHYQLFTQAVKVHLKNIVLHQADVFLHPYCVSYSLDGKYTKFDLAHPANSGCHRLISGDTVMLSFLRIHRQDRDE